MKEVDPKQVLEKKDLPEIPGGVREPYPGGADVGPPGRRFRELEDYPHEPMTATPLFES